MMFFLLVALLSAPVLTLATFDGQAVRGVPASAALAVLVPVAAALVLAYAEGGEAAARRLLKRSFDLRRLPSWRWLAAIVLVHPLLLLLQYAYLRTGASPVPPLALRPLDALLLLCLFLIPAWGEEMGWTGYVTDPLRRSVGPILAALTLGAFLALWHVVPLLAVGRSLEWIGWWALGTLAARILFLWIYARGGGSVAGAVLLHATSNVAWQLFPIAGSHYDPRIGSLLVCVLALPAAADLGMRQPAAPSGA